MIDLPASQAGTAVPCPSVASSNTESNPPTDTTQARPPFRVRVEQARTILRERYPALFAAADPKPLKIGIHKDLLERHPELDLSGLKRALTLHTGRFGYQKLLKAGAVRFDLDGQPADEVTEEQAEIARQRLAELKAALKAKESAKAAKSPAPATPVPTPAPTPPPAPAMPPNANPERPVLRLKKSSGPVVSAAVTRKGAAK